jgi:hypothetical protein
MSNHLFSQLTKKYPFISLCVYADNEYVGIIQNQDDIVTTFYDFGSLHTIDQKRKFLELANVWWFESNRKIPINIFLKSEWSEFKFCIKTFMNKDLEIIHGPICSLSDLIQRKSKRKSIILVRKINL